MWILLAHSSRIRIYSKELIMARGQKIKIISETAKKIRKKGEIWQEAVKRATIELKKLKKI